METDRDSGRQIVTSDAPTARSIQENDYIISDSPLNTSRAISPSPIAPDVPNRSYASPTGSHINTGGNHYNPSSNQRQIPISAERRAESLYGPSLTNLKAHATWNLVITLLLDYFPRQIYLYLLLRLPVVYFSRVAAIFEESALTLSEIKRMTLESSFNNKGLHHASPYQDSTIPLRYKQLDDNWNSFVDSLLRDWNTYNIVSALILSAILTILQIDTAAQDPLIRYTLLFSQICAITSLLLGCLYSIRFDSSMRRTYKAAEWAHEAQRSKTSIWWNIWILLAMPAIWLAWSSIFYIIAIMAFVWRTDTSDSSSPAPLSPHILLLVRILITLVLALGLTSGWLSLMMFRRYGHGMDRTWATRVNAWADDRYQMNANAWSDSIALGINDLDPPASFQPGNVDFNLQDSDHSVVSHPPVGSASSLRYQARHADEEANGTHSRPRSHYMNSPPLNPNLNSNSSTRPSLSLRNRALGRENSELDGRGHSRPHVDIEVIPQSGDDMRLRSLRL